MSPKQISINISANSSKEEYEHLKSTVSKMPFYLEHGYKVELPELEELKSEKVLTDEKHMFKIFLEREYDKNFFTEGIKNIKEKVPLIESCFPKLIELNKLWDFKLFKTYSVLLTKYGPGGSYDSRMGKIIMLTRKNGTFKRENPEQTVVHEIVHIGIEDSIVKTFKLSHSEKERLVDLLVKNLFSPVFPDYNLQSIGDARIDAYTNGDSINNLPSAIERYVERFPR